MKKLFEIVQERNAIEIELKEEIKSHNNKVSVLEKQISELKRLESIGENNIDLEKVRVAEKILSVGGNPYGKTDDVIKFGYKTIAEQAIIDIADGCPHLKRRYFGNKRYEGFYQGCDCEYGYGPRHGSIVDRIELRNTQKELSDEEKDACIYYLKNYVKIKELATQKS